MKTFTEMIGDPIVERLDSMSGVSMFSAPGVLDIGGMLAVIVLENVFDVSYAIEKKLFGWIW